ncbi:MAG: hypothetical protein ATN33_03925 [Epulopiscium sp. Nele67-Bin001]|nr:MAG: hypothetical protein ATN33_03925 [Epulopiscium sp. Nele67-Bin001]
MKTNRITRTRLLILFVLFLFFSFGGYFIGANTEIILPVFNCEYVGGGTTRGVCIAMTEFNKHIHNGWTFPLGVAACIALVLLFGRLWCGYVCPMGFFQDVVTWIRQKLNITQINIPQKLKPFILVGRWYLVFYIFFYDLCKVCPVQFITVPLTGYTSNTGSTGFFWTVVLLVAVMLSDRAFCRVCPIGALMGLANRISGSRLRKCGHACTHCRACLEVCPVDIQEVYEDREHVDITHADCIYCMKCIEVCPEKDALRFDLFGKTIYSSDRVTQEGQHGAEN